MTTSTALTDRRASAAPRAGPGSARSRRRGAFWLFIAPFLAGLLIFVYIPIGWSIYLSLFNAHNTVSPTAADFVGFGNYSYLLGNHAFLTSLGTFIVFAVFIVPTTYAISLGLALLVNKARIARSFFRSVFFIPTAVSYVIAAMIWRLTIFSGAKFGMINSAIRALGGSQINWLGGGNYWYWLVLITLRLWLQVGFYMILFIAGLNRIGRDTYEAAALDGATGVRVFRYITWPQLAATTAAIVLLLIINAFQAFDEFYNTLISNGTYPPFARPPLVYLYLISLGGGSQDLGVGSAGTMLLTLVIAVFGVVQLLVTSRISRRMR